MSISILGQELVKEVIDQMIQPKILLLTRQELITHDDKKIIGIFSINSLDKIAEYIYKDFNSFYRFSNIDSHVDFDKLIDMLNTINNKLFYQVFISRENSGCPYLYKILKINLDEIDIFNKMI